MPYKPRTMKRRGQKYAPRVAKSTSTMSDAAAQTKLIKLRYTANLRAEG